jgi:hypothetical protein
LIICEQVPSPQVRNNGNHYGSRKLSKKDLVKLVYELRIKLKELEEGNKRLRDQQKPSSKQLRLRFSIFRRPAKMPGQKEGHLGMMRVKPKRVDRVIEQTLERCPKCDKRLVKPSD